VELLVVSDVVLEGAAYVRHSDKAVLLRWQDQELWIPLTQLRAVPRSWERAPDSIARGDEVAISEWIAAQKGIDAAATAAQRRRFSSSADDDNAVLAQPAMTAVGQEAQNQALTRAELARLRGECAELKRQLDAANKRANDAFMQVQSLEQRMRVRDEELSKLRAKNKVGSAAGIAETQAKPTQTSVPTTTESQSSETHRFNVLEID
jgi:chromosome segregation ATPase